MSAHDGETQNLDLDRLLDDIRSRVHSRLSARSVSNDRFANEPDPAERHLTRNLHEVAAVLPDLLVPRQSGRAENPTLTEHSKAPREDIERIQMLGLQIGQLPPAPPSLRGRAGRMLVRLITRCLWWNLSQVQSFAAACVQALHGQADYCDRLAAALRPDLTQQVNHLVDGLSSLKMQYGLEVRGIQARQLDTDRRVNAFHADSHLLQADLRRLESRIASIAAERESATEVMRRVESQVAEVEARTLADREHGAQAQQRLEDRLADETFARERAEKQTVLRHATPEQGIAFERDAAAQNLQRLQNRLETEALAREELDKQLRGVLNRLERPVSEEIDAAEKDRIAIEKAVKAEARDRKEWVAQISVQVGEVQRTLEADRATTNASTQLLRECLDAEINAREQVEGRVAGLVRLDAPARLAEAEEHLKLAKQASRHLRQDLVLMDRRVSLLLEEARKRLPDTFDLDQLTNLAKQEEHKLDALYLTFEDTFRGPRDLIKNRQRVYLPYLEAAGIGGKEMPVLDVGCGRGELLELLRDVGLHARGIDCNHAMVALCQELGLDVQQADIQEHLSGVPDASLGGVTLSHVVEHLPYPLVIAFFDEVLRTLKPGGMLILETPNPQNIQVGAHTFYTDPTHRNPLPSNTLKFFVEARGFTDVQILPLSPYPDSYALPEDSELAKRFNAHFYGPQDYAVIGRKT